MNDWKLHGFVIVMLLFIVGMMALVAAKGIPVHQVRGIERAMFSFASKEKPHVYRSIGTRPHLSA